MAALPDLDVSQWDLIAEEPMGDPGKLWIKDPQGTRWLFKPVRLQHDERGAFPQGDDWAEKIVSRVGRGAGSPGSSCRARPPWHAARSDLP